MSAVKKEFFFRKTITSIIVTIGYFIIWSLGQNIALANENWVEVEQSPLVIESKGELRKVSFLDYRDRRQKYSFRFSFFSAKPEVNNYLLSSSATELSSLKSKSGGSFEGVLSVSYNMSLLSVGIDFGMMMGSFRNDVKVMQPKVGAHVIADTLFKNPYVVPFFKMGASKMTFDHPNNPTITDIAKLESNIAMYTSFGLMFALDWFQRELAMDAYFGYGLNSTLVVIEYEVFSKIPMAINEVPDLKQTNLKIGLQLVF